MLAAKIPDRLAHGSPWVDFRVDQEGFRLAWNGTAVRLDWGFAVEGRIHLTPTPRCSRLWGSGVCYELQAIWPGGLKGRIWVDLLTNWRGIVLSGEIEPPDTAVEIDRLPLLKWNFRPGEAADWRWLVNSGHQGFSGVIQLDQDLQTLPFSQDITVMSQPGTALGLANLTFRRTNLLFERSGGPDSGHVLEINLAYGGMSLAAGRLLELEMLGILPETDPLAALETCADSIVQVVRPRFHTALHGLYNQWYANWTPASDHGTAELILDGARLLRNSALYRYGICTLGSGVWHNGAAFGEESAWPGHFPAGMATVSEQIHRLGLEYMHGGFWGKVSECATVFRQHPEWMARDDAGHPAKIADESWGACPSPYYIPDITQPAVQDWMRRQWEKVRSSSTGFYWLDFYGTGIGINLDIERPAQLHFEDRELAFPFETDRLLTRIIRETVGDQAVIGVYTSPTFNLIGLIDRARMALDCGAIDPPGSTRDTTAETGKRDADRRWHHLCGVARNLAAGYFCHNRFWINDPDPAMVGLVDRPETLEEARLRVLIAANSGGMVTVGEALDRIPPARMALLKTILPPYGQAARPLDLFEAEHPAVYDLAIETAWDRWHLLTLVNWDEHEKTVSIPISRLGLGGSQLVYEFWDQIFLGQTNSTLEVRLPPRCCRLFCLRPARPYPWLLATNLHFTQGAIEAEQVAWDAIRRALRGRVYRPDGEGWLVIHHPTDFQPVAAQLDGSLTELISAQPGILRIPVRFDGLPKDWQIQFEQVEHGNHPEPAFKIRGWSLCNIQQDIAFDEAYILRMLYEAASQGMNYIELIGPYYNQPERCPVDSLVTYREFPRLNGSRSMARDLDRIRSENEKFNRICAHARSLGLQTAVWCHELWFPKDILDFYPDMGDERGQVVYSAEKFQRFLRSKYEELFETIPDLGGVVLTTSESLALNIFALPAAADQRLSRIDAYAHLIATLADVCRDYRRDLSVRMFGVSSTEQFQQAVAVFKPIDSRVRIHQKTCDHGDWHNPFQKSNPRLGAFQGREEIAEEELGQEYFGLGRFPVVFPEVLQSRARLCRQMGVRGMVARVDRGAYGSIEQSFHNRPWDHEGQLNIRVFDTLAQNPDASLADLVWPWAEGYYGAASPYALKALEQGAEIFHDLLYVYPGEGAEKHWRGSWLMAETMLDDQLGIFGALREMGGFRTPKELALARCRRILDDLRFGEKSLGGCSQEQVSHYRHLQGKFESLHLFGEQRLALLDIFSAFEALFFHSGGVLRKKQQFLAAVDSFFDRFGREAVDLFVDRDGARRYGDTITVLFKLLQATGKMDANTYRGYCGAGEV